MGHPRKRAEKRPIQSKNVPGHRAQLYTSSSRASLRSSWRKRRASLIPPLLLSPQSHALRGPLNRCNCALRGGRFGIRLHFEQDVLRNILQQWQAPAPVNRLPKRKEVTAYCLPTFQHYHPAAEQRPIRRCRSRLPKR